MRMHQASRHRDGDGCRGGGTCEGGQGHAWRGERVLGGGGSGDIDDKVREGSTGKLLVWGSKQVDRNCHREGKLELLLKKGLYVDWFGN